MIREFARLSATQLASGGALAVQPIGAVEQHGAHLPVGTDAIIAERLARAALERIGDAVDAVLLPTQSVGRSVEHLGYPGTLSWETSTLLELCRDLGRAVKLAGFERLLFVNGHGGQPGLLETVARDIRLETGMQVFVVTTARLGLPQGVTSPDASDIHAGFTETSLMLALEPELVDMSTARADGAALTAAFADADELSLEGDAPTAWLTRDLSTSGVVGDPTEANAEAGERILTHQSGRLARIVAEAATFAFPPLEDAGLGSGHPHERLERPVILP